MKENHGTRLKSWCCMADKKNTVISSDRKRNFIPSTIMTVSVITYRIVTVTVVAIATLTCRDCRFLKEHTESCLQTRKQQIQTYIYINLSVPRVTLFQIWRTSVVNLATIMNNATIKLYLFNLIFDPSTWEVPYTYST